jgi:LytS/YehU family sensor histidine kinase
MIPNMILQPYIENAIWHGIIPLQSNGRVFISFSRASVNREQLVVIIDDDGIGISNKNDQHAADENHRSFGMKLTQHRLQLLSISNRQEYAVEVNDKKYKGERGTKVQVRFPFKVQMPPD